MNTDRDYFLFRAEEEEARAVKALDQATQDALRRLAAQYREWAQNRREQSVGER